jgi:hypothetical protein
MPSATARRPEPHSWFMPQAGLSTGIPALTEAWRAGFWPPPAVRICPRITSSMSLPSSPARCMAALRAIVPSSAAGTLLKAPLNEPTGVRAAETITTEFAEPDIGRPPCDKLIFRLHLAQAKGLVHCTYSLACRTKHPDGAMCRSHIHQIGHSNASLLDTRRQSCVCCIA